MTEKLAFVVNGESRARSVAGVTLSAVTESAQKGEYVATLKGDTAGKYTVVPKYNGSAIDGLSAVVTITAVTLENISVNEYTFSPDAGFPTTGFKGAQFTLKLSGGDASDYRWTSNASWVSVSDNAVVSITGNGNGNQVIVTGTPKSGIGTVITYNFTLQHWFIGDNHEGEWDNAKAYCSGLSGYGLPTVQQLNGNSNHNNGTRGVLGGLWSEWGNLSQYSNSGFPLNYYWMSDAADNGSHYVVEIGLGTIDTNPDTIPNNIVCQTGV
ncbi:hypothetical protein AAZT04_25930, partial [Serratia sp. Je.1.23.a]